MASEIQAIEHGKERFLDLLLLADPSVEIVQQYIQGFSQMARRAHIE